jgi:exodeoxyribonuclease VIII
MIHFSELKKMALSPLHYKAAIEKATEPTRAMSVGTIAHHIVLGERTDKKLVVYRGGIRRGKEWDAFKAEHDGAEIVTVPEWDEGEAIAKAILADPVAAPFLKGQHEVPLEWDSAGMKFATRGVDVIGDGFVAELKSTASAEPGRWQRLALNMFYHVQMVMYREGAASRSLVAPDCPLYVIGCESKPPYPVTVLHLTPAMIELAQKTIAIWTERLRSCEENNFWPGYAQSVVEWDCPAWMTPDAVGEDE